MKRRTYTERRSYSARVMRFRLGVYGARRTLTPGCLLLLTRLSDDMDGKGFVSVPRSRLAADLDAPLPRITEWIAEAVEAGFLSRVRRGRPGVTSVYQGLVRDAIGVRPGVPSTRYGNPDHVGVRPGVPHWEAQRYATGGTQEGVQAVGIETAPADHPPRRGSNKSEADSEQGSPSTHCEFHGWTRCPEDCRNHPHNREATA